MGILGRGEGGVERMYIQYSCMKFSKETKTTPFDEEDTVAVFTSLRRCGGAEAE